MATKPKRGENMRAVMDALTSKPMVASQIFDKIDARYPGKFELTNIHSALYKLSSTDRIESCDPPAGSGHKMAYKLLSEQGKLKLSGSNAPITKRLQLAQENLLSMYDELDVLLSDVAKYAEIIEKMRGLD